MGITYHLILLLFATVYLIKLWSRKLNAILNLYTMIAIKSSHLRKNSKTVYWVVSKYCVVVKPIISCKICFLKHYPVLKKILLFIIFKFCGKVYSEF